MSKKQNLKTSKIYKTLSFSLLLSLMMISSPKAYTQSFTTQDRKKVIRNTVKQYTQEALRFNTITAVSPKGILIKDCITKEERIIQPIESSYSKNCVRLSTLQTHSWSNRLIDSSLWSVVFRPGDTVVVAVNGMLIPGQYVRYVGGFKRPYEYKYYADEYYAQSDVLPSVCITILAPSDEAFLARIREAREKTSQFEELKKQITNGGESR